MSIADNCVLCQYPLNQGFFKNYINKIENLPCKHQFHRLCVIAYSDSIKLRNAKENSLYALYVNMVPRYQYLLPKMWLKDGSKGLKKL